MALSALLLLALTGCGDVMHTGPEGVLADSADGLFDGHLTDQEVNQNDGQPDGQDTVDADGALDVDVAVDAQTDGAETAENAAPVLEFSKPTEGAFVQVGMPVAVSLHVADDGGAANVTVKVELQGTAPALFSGAPGADGNVAVELAALPAGAQTLVATATDAAGKSTVVERKLYVNTAPGAPVVVIEPATPTTLDALQATVVTDAFDLDRAPTFLTYSYTWFRNEELTAYVASKVPAMTAKRGETWTVKVAAADPYSVGAIGQASVVIDDSAPSTPTVAFDKANIDLSSEISCTIVQVSTDADGDAVTYLYQWYVDGALDASATTAQVLVATLQAAGNPIKKGAKIQCVVLADDGTKTSAGAATSELTVGEFNVCTSPQNPCSPLANCVGSDTLSVVCTCKNGYDGNGVVCFDIDECSDKTAGCSVTADCTNLPGTFLCTCQAGYIGNGDVCTDVDECDLQSDDCAAAALCSNTAGSFTCTCKPGYSGNGTSCTDNNECATNNGGCGDPALFLCANQLGAAPVCSDIDECLTANGGCGNASLVTCANQVGAAPVCTDIDECLLANGGCGAAQYFFCQNNAIAAPKCSDIDECAVANGGCGAVAVSTCSNQVGGPPICTDINECLVANGGCGLELYFTCTNVTADTPICTDIDECATANGGCGDPLFFTCTNQSGAAPTCGEIGLCALLNGGCGDPKYFSCTDVGGGLPTCADIDECKTANGGCGNAKYNLCKNNVGGEATCSDIDECLAANGGCGNAQFTLCTNKVGVAPVCSDVNECLVDNGGCGNAQFTACKNNLAGAPTCSDINECLVANGGCGDAKYFACKNNAAAAQTCSDINECLVSNGGCGDATYWLCQNKSGGVPACSDINECLTSNGGCGAVGLITCGNNTGSAPTCTDIDECKLSNGGCDANANCSNKVAAPVVCVCKAGYEMSGTTCVSTTPQASDVVFGGASGCLAIGYNLYQAQSLPVNIAVQYMIGSSGVWLPATAATGGDGVSLLSTSAVKPGKAHIFLWNSSVDIAADSTSTAKAVSFRVIPSIGGLNGVTATGIGSIQTGYSLNLPSIVAVGPKPRAVLAGDLNRDGKPDLLVVNSNGNGAGSVSVRLGDGLGKFTNGAAIAVGNGPLHGVLADFNRDGKIDWAVANFSGGAAGSVSVALGKGDGTFLAVTNLPVGAGPAYVATADINLDGLADLAVANVVGGTVTLLIGKGDGSFTTSAVAAGPTGGIALADLNEDGKPDLVSSTASNTVQVRLGVGNGTFGVASSVALSVPGTLQDLVVADWNRDGHLDVIGCSVLGDSLAILAGDGKGGLLPVSQTTVATSKTYRALAVGDFNQDGHPDVALGGNGSTTGLSLYLGNGGFGSSGGHSAVTGGVWDIAVADFNLDGVSDFATAIDGLETVAVVLGQLPQRCDWSLELPVTYASETGATGLTTADLNHDGLLDLITANAGNGTVGRLAGKDKGIFATPAILTASGANAHAVVTGDFNRDGTLDVASVNTSSPVGSVSILLSTGAGNGLAAAVNVAACAGAKGLATADFNRDGRLDLVTSCTTQFAVLLGNADGTFGAAQLTLLAGTPQGVATGDFNRDGIADLAFALFGSTAVSVQIGKGDGTFTASSPISVGSSGNLWSIESGDFTNDGAPDLLVVAESGGNFRLLVAKGDGTFQPPVTVAVESANPHYAVLVDLNSDGNLDFVVGYFATGKLGVYLGDGKGGFKLHTLYTGIAGGAFEAVVAGDFNRDGRMDIAVAMGGVMNKVAVFLSGNQVCQAKGPAVVLLGTAGNFVALAKAAISSVPTSVVTGNIGVSPAAATYITGFSLVADSTNVFSTATQVAGKVYAANYAVPSPANMTTAISDMETAYVDAAGRPNPDYLELGTGEIGGKTLTAGLYKWTSTVSISTDLVLTGCASDVWILQTSKDLTIAANKKVTLSGGALAKNVFWQVAGQATIGAGAHFEGIVLAKTGITLQTGASMNGRALAQTAVALQQATLAP